MTSHIKPITILQTELLETLETLPLAAYSAEELASILRKKGSERFITTAKVAGSLSSLKNKNLVQFCKLPTKEIVPISVPGRVVGVYSGNRGVVVKQKSHWFLVGKEKQVRDIRTSRYAEFNKKLEAYYKRNTS